MFTQCLCDFYVCRWIESENLICGAGRISKHLQVLQRAGLDFVLLVFNLSVPASPIPRPPNKSILSVIAAIKAS